MIIFVNERNEIKDVNTTKKHYAAIDEDRRRAAASVVKLRESSEERILKSNISYIHGE